MIIGANEYCFTGLGGREPQLLSWLARDEGVEVHEQCERQHAQTLRERGIGISMKPHGYVLRA